MGHYVADTYCQSPVEFGVRYFRDKYGCNETLLKDIMVNKVSPKDFSICRSVPVSSTCKTDVTQCVSTSEYHGFWEEI